MPVGPEIFQKFDEAVKRYNENRALAQAKARAAPRGGVTASMIVLEPDDLEHGLVVVPSATVTDPVVHVNSHNGAKRVVALPNSAILVSQEWLVTIAGWTFFSGPMPGLENSACERIRCI